MAEFHLVAQPEAGVDMHRLAALKLPAQRSGSPTTLVVLLVAGIMLSAAYLLFRYSRRSVEVQGNPPNPTGHISAATSAAATAGAPPSSTVQGAGQAGMPAAPASNPASNLPGMPATNAPAAAAAAAANPPGTPNAPGAPASNTNPATALQTGTQVASSRTGEYQPGAGGTAPPASKQVGSSSGLVLQVAATESVWVGIEADGQTVLQRVLKPNEVRTLKARESFDVTTGNAQGVILTLNGETLKPLGRRGEVKSIHLTHDDLKNPAP